MLGDAHLFSSSDHHSAFVNHFSQHYVMGISGETEMNLSAYINAKISEEESDHYRTFAAQFLWYIKLTSFWHTFFSQQIYLRMMSDYCCRSMLNSMTQVSVSLSWSRTKHSLMSLSENQGKLLFGYGLLLNYWPIGWTHSRTDKHNLNWTSLIGWRIHLPSRNPNDTKNWLF